MCAKYIEASQQRRGVSNYEFEVGRVSLPLSSSSSSPRLHFDSFVYDSTSPDLLLFAKSRKKLKKKCVVFYVKSAAFEIKGQNRKL